MKKLLAMLLALLMLCPSAGALELSDDAFAYWNQWMNWLVDNTDTRWIGTDGEAMARDTLRQELQNLGFSYENDTLTESYCYMEGVDRDLVSFIAIKPALNEDAAIVTVCAHYDSHVPGARDNASGVAAVLTMAKLFQQETFEDTELRFILFTAEESGHQGSTAYCEDMDDDVWQRSLATFNIDIITVGTSDTDHAFSMDTLGGWDGEYVDGSKDAPFSNTATKALLAAMNELGAYPAEEQNITWCGPRHLGMSDHESFHNIAVDSVNVCFRGNPAEGGNWPSVMHTADDLPHDLDMTRTRNALNAVYTALDGLARDNEYGN